MRVAPPAKQAGKPTGRRRLDGAVLDVAGVTTLIGGTEKMTRARVARRELPHRRWGGRIVFLRGEILKFLDALPGVGVEAAIANVAARAEAGR